MSTVFPIRMLYATTPQTREKAAQMGCNWALVHTMGHKAHRSNENPRPNDDLPIYFTSVPQVAALRRAKRKGIEFEKRILCESVDHAHKLGMKAMIHSYEVSIPPECKNIYPSMYRPFVKEYRNCCAETRSNREPCLSDPDVRELISLKIAEVIRLVPDLDAYAFSFNECLSLTKIRHRCERCRDLPFWQMILWLEESVHAGVESVNPKIRLFHRTWGLNEHDDQYQKSMEQRLEFSRGDVSKAWLPAHAKVYAPRNMHYKPSEDFAKYLELVKGKDLGFITKATGADVALGMPLNPWIRHLKGFDTIVELSWERTVEFPDTFHVLSEQFPRAARLSRDNGVTGVVGVPVHWGDKYHERETERNDLDEGWWRLSMLNFDVFEAVSRNPDADMFKVIDKALKTRFGTKLPAPLVNYVIESQTITSEALNIRGIQAMGWELDGMYEEILRYGPFIKNWKSRVSRSPANIRRILADKDAVMARAKAIVADIRTYEGKIPERAYAEFLSSFTDLYKRAVRVCQRQKFNMLLWALKDGTMPCDMKMVHVMGQCLRNSGGEEFTNRR